MKIIISEEEFKQLEEIGFISVDQLETMLENAAASHEEIEVLHIELKARGVIITENAPPNLPRHPHNAEADQHASCEEEELNS